MIALFLVAALQGPPDVCLNEQRERVYCGDAAAIVGPILDPDAQKPLDPSAPITVALAGRMGGHLARIGFGWSADTFATAWALDQCPNCYERNAAGFSAESRMATKLAGSIVLAGVCWQFEKWRHPHAAKAASWGALGAQLIFAGIDARHALRRR
jgi:hypothetical protein